MSINEEYEVKIIRRNNEGEGVCKINDIVVFVNGALEDEQVKIKIDRVEKNYAHAKTLDIISISKNRVEPKCPYYGKCGGCNIMHEDYKSQLNFKKQKIKSILKKICDLDIDLDIEPSEEFYYRNKVTLKVENEKIGFFKNNTNDIVDIDMCSLANSNINNIIKRLKKFITLNNKNDISEIMIRNCENNIMLSLDNLNENLIDLFIKDFNDISIYIKNRSITGTPKLIQEQNDMKFYISPKSFFQVNKTVSEKLFNFVKENVKENNVLDLYSGTGTIALILSKSAKKVIGIEVVKDAVKDANENLKLNEINNVKFICGKVENKIDEIKNESIDTIILDPPRSGSDKKSLKTILEINPKRIIYVSCNPVTLARDYNVLKDNYKLEKIKAFDMFPQTEHVETVMVLERK